MSTSQSTRRALIALLLLAPAPSIGAAMGLWIAPGPIGKTVYFLSKCWILALPAFWLQRIEKQRPSLSPPRHGGFVFGVASGLVIGATILAAYHFALAARIDPAPLRAQAAAAGFDRVAIYIAFAAWFCTINAVIEEYVWRWFVYTRCEMLMPRYAAVVLAAALFTAHHVIVLRAFFPWPLALFASAGVFTGGAVWSWSYLRYRSIWPGYVSHAIVDAAILIVGWKMLFG